MLTEFGKILRKIRIDHQELLRDMALVLGVSSAYLSAVETGKRKVPTSWVAIIIEHYKLNAEQAALLKNAFEDSQGEVSIPLHTATAQQRCAAISFAKALQGLSDEDVEKIMKIVQKGQKKE